jgi:hypothetical protein
VELPQSKRCPIVSTQQPEVTRPCGGYLQRGRRIVGIGDGRARSFAHDLGDLLVGPAELLDVDPEVLQLPQLDGQQVHIPRAVLRCRIVREAIGLRLLRRQVGHVHGHLRQTQLLRRLPPRMTNDDHTVAVNHNRLAKPILLDRPRHGIDGGIVQARVAVIRTNVIDGAEFHLHLVTLSQPRGVRYAGSHRRR